MQCVHGFFGLNAFLLGFPFSQRRRVASRSSSCVNEPLNFRLSRAHSLFKRFRYSRPALSIAVLLRDTCAARMRHDGLSWWSRPEPRSRPGDLLDKRQDRQPGTGSEPVRFFFDDG
jgi:hypothetical protein